MALGTEAAAVNTKVDELAAAWETYIETLTVGDRILVVPVESLQGTGTERAWGSDASLIFDPTNKRYVLEAVKVTNPGSIPLRIGPHPHLFKVTNEAGDLTA